MATEQQIAANRRNAQLSTGPKTEAGRKVSRLNALRHGLTGQIEVTTPEEKEAKTKFFSEIISALAPENAVEHQFAHSIADGHWRLNRASSIENNIFTLACSFEEKQTEQVRREAELDDNASDTIDEIEDTEVEKALGAARVFIADPRRFQLLTIYEGRIHRTMSKNLKHLTELQTARRTLQAETEAIQKAQRDQALDEARLHTQLAEMEGVPCDIATDFPDPNGFVFSPAEIAQTIRRIGHLKTARAAESSGWKPAIRRAA